MDEAEITSATILEKYKEQSNCERGFKFLKDPLFFADSFFVEKPQREETRKNGREKSQGKMKLKRSKKRTKKRTRKNQIGAPYFKKGNNYQLDFKGDLISFSLVPSQGRFIS